jgi:hypothetical protein
MEPVGEHWCDNWRAVAFNGATPLNPKDKYSHGGSRVQSNNVSKLTSSVVSGVQTPLKIFEEQTDNDYFGGDFCANREKNIQEIRETLNDSLFSVNVSSRPTSEQMAPSTKRSATSNVVAELAAMNSKAYH